MFETSEVLMDYLNKHRFMLGSISKNFNGDGDYWIIWGNPIHILVNITSKSIVELQLQYFKSDDEDIVSFSSFPLSSLNTDNVESIMKNEWSNLINEDLKPYENEILEVYSKHTLI